MDDPAAPPAAIAQDAQESGPPPAPFWTPKRALIIGGFGASAAAASMTWIRERQLGSSRRQLEALPPGAVDQWNAEYASATRVMKSRDFWRSVAIGVGGVTVGYLITSASSDVAPLDPAHRRARRTWLIGPNLLGLGVSVVGSF